MPYPAFETLQLDVQGRVATLWLNRPDTRNAFNETMIAELSSAFDALAADAAVRAVVLAGRGSAFCAGADLNWMKKMSGYGYDENYADATALAAMLHKLYALSKPTVARVHGPAFAGGMGLVAACDIAVASTAARFKLSEVLIGLTPATISPYVMNAMGERESRRYFLTAETFGAEEAFRTGLVHVCVAPEKLDEAVAAMTGNLVLGGPAAMAVTKNLIRDVARTPLDEKLRAETARYIAAIRASEEGKEGILSFLEKRKPKWVG
jgi:methylglutaconyl-CoA hydratase